MALAEWISLVSFIVALFGSVLGLVNIWYIRERTKAKGPKMNIPYIEFDEITEKKAETGVTINVLFQNVGDRMTFLVIKRITIKKDIDEEVRKPVILQPEIDEEGLMFPPQSQKVKKFDIKIPLSRDNLIDSDVMIHTIFTDHIGNLLEKGWKFEIDSELVGNLVYVWKKEKILKKEQKRIDFSEKSIEQTSFKVEEDIDKKK